MDEDGKCCCEEKHKNHLCVLQRKGLIHQVQSLTCTPSVECEICNRMANSEDDVCIPVPLFI
jgi:hypothetical protein